MKIGIQRYNRQSSARPNLLQSRQLNMVDTSPSFKTLKDVSNTLERMKEDRDNAKVNEAKALFQKASDDKLMELKQKFQGVDATPEKLKEEYSKWEEQFKADNFSDLSTTQRKKMEGYFTGNSVSVNNNMNYYSVQQLEQAKQASYKTALSTLGESIAYEKDVSNINIKLQEAKDVIIQQNSHLGEDVANYTFNEYKSKVLTNNIMSEGISNPTSAIMRYNTFVNELSKEDSMKVMGELHKSFIDTEANKMAEASVRGINYIPTINKQFAEYYGGKEGADLMRKELDLQASKLIPAKKEQQTQAIQKVQGEIFTAFSNIRNSNKPLSEQNNDLAQVNITGISAVNPQILSTLQKLPNEIQKERTARKINEPEQLKRDEYSAKKANNIREGIANSFVRTFEDIDRFYGEGTFESLTATAQADLLSELGSKIKFDEMIGENKSIENALEQAMLTQMSSIENETQLKNLPKFQEMRFMVLKEAEKSGKGLLNYNNLSEAANKVLSTVDKSWKKSGQKEIKELDVNNEKSWYEFWK